MLSQTHYLLLIIRGSPTLINTSSPIICYNNERSLRRSSDKRRSRITNYKKTVIIEPRNLMDVSCYD